MLVGRPSHCMPLGSAHVGERRHSSALRDISRGDTCMSHADIVISTCLIQQVIVCFKRMVQSTSPKCSDIAARRAKGHKLSFLHVMTAGVWAHPLKMIETIKYMCACWRLDCLRVIKGSHMLLRRISCRTNLLLGSSRGFS